MLRYIQRYNNLQSILNEDIFGPLQIDSVIILVQVKYAITTLNSKMSITKHIHHIGSYTNHIFETLDCKLRTSTKYIEDFIDIFTRLL